PVHTCGENARDHERGEDRGRGGCNDPPIERAQQRRERCGGLCDDDVRAGPRAGGGIDERNLDALCEILLLLLFRGSLEPRGQARTAAGESRDRGGIEFDAGNDGEVTVAESERTRTRVGEELRVWATRIDQPRVSPGEAGRLASEV